MPDGSVWGLRQVEWQSGDGYGWLSLQRSQQPPVRSAGMGVVLQFVIGVEQRVQSPVNIWLLHQYVIRVEG